MVEDLLRAMRTGTLANLGRPVPESALSTDLGHRPSFGSPLLGEPGGIDFDFGSVGGGGGGPGAGAGATTRMGRARAGTMDSLEEEELPLPASLAAMRLTSIAPPATLPPIASGSLLATGDHGYGQLLPPSAPMSLNPSSATATSQSSAGGPAELTAQKEKKRHHFLGGLMRRSHSGDGGRAKGHKERGKGDAEVVEGIRRSATLNMVH